MSALQQCGWWGGSLGPKKPELPDHSNPGERLAWQGLANHVGPSGQHRVTPGGLAGWARGVESPRGGQGRNGGVHDTQGRSGWQLGWMLTLTPGWKASSTEGVSLCVRLRAVM